jgi:hypothetical protein
MAKHTLCGLAGSMLILGAVASPSACSSGSGDKSPDGNSTLSSSASGGGGAGAEASVASDDDASDGASGCQTGGLPTDTYGPNLKKLGRIASGGDSGSASGTLTFDLVGDDIEDAAAAPAEPYMNYFTLRLLDASGQPVNGATVVLPTDNQALGWNFSKDPWMPLHGHGDSIVPTVTNNGDGTYTLAMHFFMAGLWQIYVVAETSTETDSTMYSFCLQ